MVKGGVQKEQFVGLLFSKCSYQRTAHWSHSKKNPFWFWSKWGINWFNYLCQNYQSSIIARNGKFLPDLSQCALPGTVGKLKIVSIKWLSKDPKKSDETFKAQKWPSSDSKSDIRPCNQQSVLKIAWKGAKNWSKDAERNFDKSRKFDHEK